MIKINNIRKALSEFNALIYSDPIQGRTGDVDGTVFAMNKPISPGTECDIGWTEEGDYSGSIHPSDVIEPIIDDDIDPIIEHGAIADDQVPLLGDTDEQKMLQNIKESGTDALGYYRSFHITGRQWGVFITCSGVQYMAKQFSSLHLSRDVALKNAFQLILSHELFHFAVDYALSQLEIILRQPLWSPSKGSLLAKNPKYLLSEEKMANAYMMCRARTGRYDLKIPGKMDCLKRFIKKQPLGYCDALGVTYKSFDDGLSGLGIDLISEARNGGAIIPSPGLEGFSFDWPNIFQHSPQVDWRYCPIFLVDDTKQLLNQLPDSYISAFAYIDSIEEPPKFRKKLSKLPSKIQKKWSELKSDISIGIRTRDNFKKWPPGGRDMWSVRVDSFRAHLWYDRVLQKWTAAGIGNHKEMGHG